MAVNKVVYDGETLVDLTEDTVTEDALAKGATAHNAAGLAITGTFEDKIEHIQVNGVEQEIVDKTVNLKLPTDETIEQLQEQIKNLQNLVNQIIMGRVEVGAINQAGAGVVSYDGTGKLLIKKIDVIEVES